MAGTGAAQDSPAATEQDTETISPEEIVTGWISELGAFDFLTIDAGGVSYDEGSGVTSVSDLSISFELDPGEFFDGYEPGQEIPDTIRYELNLPEVEFTDLDLDQDAYSATSIRLEGGEGRLEMGDEASSVTRLTEYEITDATWAKLPEIEEDPDHPVSRFYPIAEALLDFSFSGAEIGPIVSISRESENDTKTTIIYGPGSLGETIHGDISELKVEGFSLVVTGSEGGDTYKVRATGGPVQAEGYNYGSFLRNFAPGGEASGGGDRPYSPFIQFFEFPDLTVARENETTGEQFFGSVDSLLVEDIGIRAPSLPILERLDEWMVASHSDKDFRPDELELLELAASVYGTLRLGHFEMSGLYFEVPDALNGGVETFTVRDLSAAGLGEYSQEGVEVHGPDDLFYKLEQAAVQDIRFPPFSALVGYPAAQEAGDFQAILKAIPTVGRILYSGFEVRVPDEFEVMLDSALLEMTGHVGPFPTGIALDIDGFRMPVSQMEEGPREQLEALGYDQIDASLSIDMAWDEDAETADIASTGSFADGGNFDFGATLGGVTRALFEDPQTAAAMAMTNLTFNGASLHFENESIRDRAIDRIAELQGTDPEMIRQMGMGTVPFLMASLQRPELTKMVVDAVRTFFEGEGNLNVEAAPAEPVPALLLMMGVQSDPGGLADSLNVTITAE